MNKNNCNEYIYNRYNGIITTYKKIRDKEYLCIETGLTICFDLQLLLGKNSDNIIDLIEVNDYVNGMLVVNVTEIILDDKSIKEKIVFVNRDENCTLKPLQIFNGDIKSIVTKEQFKTVEYKVGG